MVTTIFPNNVYLTSDFCSGNLATARLGTTTATSCSIIGSTAGDLNAENYSTWFYFMVKAPPVSPENGNEQLGCSYTIYFTIQNMNGQTKLFKQGMKIVVKCGEKGQWTRLQEKMHFEEQNDGSEKYELKFKLSIPSDRRGANWYLAYCFPWSYEDNNKMLDQFEQQFRNHSKIYFHRELLIKSLEGRNVEILTVTSRKGLSNEREEHLEGLYPIASQRRAKRFPNKKSYLVTARVHPGESPGSHIFNGFLKFILHTTDPRAAILRDNYVFKFIPILNPDGVSRGHYRADTQGLNLNRFYKDPEIDVHPSIYATKMLAGYLAEKCNLHMYVDLHAHATKRGHFIFGNALPEIEQQIENVMYSKLVAMNTQHLDFYGGNFSEKSMSSKDRRDGLSKEGTGRVAMYEHTGLIHCYTLEGNYNTGKGINHIGEISAPKSNQLAPDIPTYTKQCPKYEIEIFEDVGKALCTALLDILLGDANQYTRLKNTSLRNIEGVRKWTAKTIRRKKKFWRDASKKQLPIWERYGSKSVTDELTQEEAKKNTSIRDSDSEDDSQSEDVFDDIDNESSNKENNDKWSRKINSRIVTISEHTPPHRQNPFNKGFDADKNYRRKSIGSPLTSVGSPSSPQIEKRDRAQSSSIKQSNAFRNEHSIEEYTSNSYTRKISSQAIHSSQISSSSQSIISSSVSSTKQFIAHDPSSRVFNKRSTIIQTQETSSYSAKEAKLSSASSVNIIVSNNASVSKITKSQRAVSSIPSTRKPKKMLKNIASLERLAKPRALISSRSQPHNYNLIKFDPAYVNELCTDKLKENRDSEREHVTDSDSSSSNIGSSSSQSSVPKKSRPRKKKIKKALQA